MPLQSLYIDTSRTDYIFSAVDAVEEAVDPSGWRFVALRLNGTSSVEQRAYLGTAVFQASTDASGTFQVHVNLDGATKVGTPFGPRMTVTTPNALDLPFP